MKKHHCTPSQVINRIDFYVQATKKEKLCHGDLAGLSKILRALRDSRIEFSLTDNLTDCTEIYLMRKKSKLFFRLKQYTAKPKSESKLMQRLSDIRGEFD